MYVLTRVFVFFIYARVSLSYSQIWISTFWRLKSLEIIYLSSFIFCSLLFLSALVLVDFYVVRLPLYFISSVVFYLTLIYLYSIFMNYYFFYFRCIIKYSVSVICDFIYNVVF